MPQVRCSGLLRTRTMAAGGRNYYTVIENRILDPMTFCQEWTLAIDFNSYSSIGDQILLRGGGNPILY